MNKKEEELFNFRSSGGKARWKGVSKEQRSKHFKRLSKLAHAKHNKIRDSKVRLENKTAK